MLPRLAAVVRYDASISPSHHALLFTVLQFGLLYDYDTLLHEYSKILPGISPDFSAVYSMSLYHVNTVYYCSVFAVFLHQIFAV